MRFLLRPKVFPLRKHSELRNKTLRNGEFSRSRSRCRSTVVVPSFALATPFFLTSSRSECEYAVPTLSTAGKIGTIDISTLEGGESLQERMMKAIETLYRKVVEYLSCTARILFCSLVTTPVAVASPIAMLIGKEKELWEYLIWCIELLGPTFIKMAQWAATRPDLFPPELTERLVKLQDSTTLHPWSVAESTLIDSFGESYAKHLDINRKPIGSGCIAQVYKGRHKSEEGKIQDVAIKLIHPHIQNTVKLDMKILKGFVWFIELIPGLHYMSLSRAVDQFAKSMQDQLDLRREAANMNKFIDDFKEDKNVEFSKPIEGFITKNALVETLMVGEPIANFMDSSVDNELKLKLSKLCCDHLLSMVFIHNFVHGDLHPGNILVRMDKSKKEPVVIYLDCGIVTTVTEEDHKTFIDICLSLLHFDGYKAGLLMLEHRDASSENHTEHSAIEGFCNGIQDIVEKAKAENCFENISDYISRICGLSCKYSCPLMPDVINVAMAVKVCEGIALALNPDLEMAKVAIPTVVKGQAKYLINQAKKKSWFS